MQVDSKLEKIVANLKKEHGTTFTALQYRIWAELIDSDLASSTKPLKTRCSPEQGVVVAPLKRSQK